MKNLIKALSLSIVLGAASSAMAMEPDEESANTVINTNTNTSCTYEGHVIRVSAYKEFQDSYVYWREKARDNFYYYAKTDDDRLLNAAMHAMVGPKRVQIRTNYCSDGRSKGHIEFVRLNP